MRMGNEDTPRAAVISIGTELTLGQISDINAQFIACELAACGVSCIRHTTVPDDLDLIRDAFLTAAVEVDLIVATGGLGPTADDLTREALAEAAGTKLAPDAASLEQIHAFFARREREMPESNAVQALVPLTGRALPNSHGTAPGLHVKLGQAECYVLPGVPFEMREMFRLRVGPEIRAIAGGRVLLSRSLHCFGISEAELGKRITDLMVAGANPGVGTTAELGVISVRINASAESAEAAEAMIAESEADIRGRLGRAVFGADGDTLASAVGTLLRDRGETLSTAESCTGGLIAKLLTDTPGSSEYFVGGAVTYSNELKRRLLGVGAETLAESGAVSAATARAMAEGARREFCSTYALSATGVAGPGGGTPDKPVGLVYFGLATPTETLVRELRFGGDYPRNVIRERAARTALNILRYELL